MSPARASVAPVYELVDDLAGATVFLLDEFGGLPGDDPGRCDAMIRRHLTDHLTTTSEVLGPDVDGPDPTSAAERYRASIAGGIDLAVVGIGPNGHIGMNEPGTAITAPTRVVDLHPETSKGASAYGATRPPSWGITVGMAEMMAANELWLLVSGAHKKDILCRAGEEPIGPSLPATYLRLHRNARVITDRSASGQS